jgi:hypothetical protein
MPAAVASLATIREKSRRYCWDSPMILESLLFSSRIANDCEAHGDWIVYQPVLDA